jgi:predicted esterase
MGPQRPPIRVDAPNATPGNAGTLIFLHGYGDDGDGWTSKCSPATTVLPVPTQRTQHEQ